MAQLRCHYPVNMSRSPVCLERKRGPATLLLQQLNVNDRSLRKVILPFRYRCYCHSPGNRGQTAALWYRVKGRHAGIEGKSAEEKISPFGFALAECRCKPGFYFGQSRVGTAGQGKKSGQSNLQESHYIGNDQHLDDIAEWNSTPKELRDRKRTNI